MRGTYGGVRRVDRVRRAARVDVLLRLRLGVDVREARAVRRGDVGDAVRKAPTGVRGEWDLREGRADGHGAGCEDEGEHGRRGHCESEVEEFSGQLQRVFNRLLCQPCEHCGHRAAARIPSSSGRLLRVIAGVMSRAIHTRLGALEDPTCAVGVEM
jgi:hypothetical protein